MLQRLNQLRERRKKKKKGRGSGGRWWRVVGGWCALHQRRESDTIPGEGYDACTKRIKRGGGKALESVSKFNIHFYFPKVFSTFTPFSRVKIVVGKGGRVANAAVLRTVFEQDGGVKGDI